MRPTVNIFAAVSADGYTGWLPADLAIFYGLVQAEPEDAALAGSNTILAVPGGEPDPASEPDRTRFNRSGPLLVVVDSRGRIDTWDWLRRQPHWRDVVVVGSEATPDAVRATWSRRGLRQVIAGSDRVDLAEALRRLREDFGVTTLRVESGGTLNGVLMDYDLVDEIATLVHPFAVGGAGQRTLLCGATTQEPFPLQLVSDAELPGGLLHVRYRRRRD
jgi:2,5-diamino-6-(ribosylamino)-4(3H)-pyrimidinone 5'-phosphate reductase